MKEGLSGSYGTKTKRIAYAGSRVGSLTSFRGTTDWALCVHCRLTVLFFLRRTKLQLCVRAAVFWKVPVVVLRIIRRQQLVFFICIGTAVGRHAICYYPVPRDSQGRSTYINLHFHLLNEYIPILSVCTSIIETSWSIASSPLTDFNRFLISRTYVSSTNHILYSRSYIHCCIHSYTSITE